MSLTYIHHSCFALVEDSFVIVYDYWIDPQNTLRTILNDAESQGKWVYFITSHFHADHYNPDIPTWCAEHEQWHYLPSYDTFRRRHIAKDLPLAVLRFGDVVETPHFRIHAYHSTDVGISSVTVLNNGTTLYHAGDNNNWYFPSSQLPDSARVRITADQMEKLYLSTLREIKADFPTLDHAMLPVDDRLGQEMIRGLIQFLDTIQVRHPHPMHYCLVPTPDPTTTTSKQ